MPFTEGVDRGWGYGDKWPVVEGSGSGRKGAGSRNREGGIGAGSLEGLGR